MTMMNELTKRIEDLDKVLKTANTELESILADYPNQPIFTECIDTLYELISFRHYLSDIIQKETDGIALLQNHMGVCGVDMSQDPMSDPKMKEADAILSEYIKDGGPFHKALTPEYFAELKERITPEEKGV